MSGLIKKDDQCEHWRLQCHEKAKSETVLLAEIDRLKKVAASQDKAYGRVMQLLDAIINRLLRQTIAQMTHAERNRSCREISKEALQIMEIATDDYPHGDIPF